MKKYFSLLLIIGFCTVKINLLSAQSIGNTQYELSLTKNNILNIKHKISGKNYQITPAFTIIKSIGDPKLIFKNYAEKFMTQPIGEVRIPSWKNTDGEEIADLFKIGTHQEIKANGGVIKGNAVLLNFAETQDFSFTARVELLRNSEPTISYSFTPKTAAYYSIGFTGMPINTQKDIDAVWQPPVWQEKRFPEISFLSLENMCSSLPGSMVEKDGLTFGVLADPSAIPYRLPNFSLGEIKFGTLVRNKDGNAQPMIFAPVLGNKDSKLSVNQIYSFKIRLFFYKGKQTDGYIYAAKNIFGFRDYRSNVYVNLNETIENMVNFEMDDVYSRWNMEMKGFDYSTDVASTVKNVSGLHPLSVAILTDHKGIYTRRALPMIEYLMSREKYLFSINKTITRQQPSSRMNGPAVEVSEMAALSSFYNRKAPIFDYFADSLSRTSRQLNLTKVSEGSDWPNLLSLYKMTGKTEYLVRAKQKADEYIAQRITKKQTDFLAASREQAAQFWTDYAPLWIELLNLYEVVKDKKYLDAATEGAKLYTQYVWFYPVIPEKTLKINENGLVKNMAMAAVRDKIESMIAPAQEVPAWRVSQIGLTPEASNTIATNPAIFLTHFAPHLLRLAYYTKDDFFRSVARSAVVGRYANYPGYDIDGEFNTVYSRPDYPLRYQNEVSYNQFYYNHVWPQIAMLFDYLISDVFASSNGQINFPSEFAAGYAYLKTNVYGAKKGTFYADTSVSIWMPKQILKINNEQINYLTAYGNGKFYIVLLNQSDQNIETELSINPDVVPLNLSALYTANTWINNQSTSPTAIKNGKMKVKIRKKGITAYSIEGINVVTQFQQNISVATSKRYPQSYQIINSPIGNINASLITFGKLSNAYIWLAASNEEATSATLYYRVSGQKEWTKNIDTSYPFEFSFPLKQSENEIEWWLAAVNKDGKLIDAGTAEKFLILKRP